jgi:hypothetical protein
MLATNPEINQGLIPEDWSLVKSISEWDKETIDLQTGLPNVSAKVAVVVLFFSMPEKFITIAPELYGTLKGVFKMDA